MSDVLTDDWKVVQWVVWMAGWLVEMRVVGWADLMAGWLVDV